MKRIIRVIIFLLLIASFLNLLKVLLQSSWPDFSIFYHSARVAIKGIDPYTLQGIFIGGFLYSPICLVLFYPFALLPFVIAGQIWAIVSIICFSFGCWLLLKMYKTERNYVLVCIAGILVFNFFPVKFTLGAGQINNVVFLLIAAALYTGKKKKVFLSGALFGLSLLLKYYPLFIILYLLVKKKWQMLFGLCVTIVVLFSVSFLFFTPVTIFYFFHHVLFSISTSPKNDYYNQALSGFLLRDFGQLTNSQFTVLNIVLSVVFLIVSLWIIVKRPKSNQNLEISIFVILSLLLNTFSWQHHFVLLLIPLCVTYFTLKEKKLEKKYYFIPALSYILATINLKTPSEFPVIFQAHAFYGAVLLWLFDLYLLYKYKT